MLARPKHHYQRTQIAAQHDEEIKTPRFQCVAPVQYHQWMRNIGSFHLTTVEALLHSEHSDFMDIQAEYSASSSALKYSFK